MSVNVDSFAISVTDAVSGYTLDVTAVIEDIIDVAADKILKEVRMLAPKRTGEYAKTFIKTNKSLPGERRYYVWNKKHYRRVHLLEFGHAKVGGGRVRAYPHMKPAHDKYAEEVYRSIMNAIMNGG